MSPMPTAPSLWKTEQVHVNEEGIHMNTHAITVDKIEIDNNVFTVLVKHDPQS